MYLAILTLKDTIYKRTFTVSSNGWGEGSSYTMVWGHAKCNCSTICIIWVVHDAESENKLPREAIGKIIGNLIRTEG